MKIAFYIVGLLFCILTVNAKWEKISNPWNGFPSDQNPVVGIVAIDLKQQNIIYCESIYHGYKLLISFDYGDTWSEVPNFPKAGGNIGPIAASYPNIAVAGDSGNDLYITTDAGETWKIIDTLCYYNDYYGKGNELYQCLIDFIRLQYYDDILFVGGSNGFFKSTNNGIDWLPLLGHNYPLFETEPTSWYVKGDTIVLRANGILFSSDKGQTWELRVSGIKEATSLGSYKYIENLFAINDTLFVSFDTPGLDVEDILYESTDFGESWFQVFKFPFIWRESYYHVYMPSICNDDMIFFVFGFLYMVQDFGKSWKDITYTDGLPYQGNAGYIFQLVFNDKYAYTTNGDWETNGVSLYRTRFENCEFVDLINDLKDQKYENNNFRIIPNPTSDKIKINSTSPAVGFAEIEIMNYMGIKIKKEQFQSQDDIELDVSDLASGLYFATIRTGGQVETKQFLIIR